MTVGRTVVRVVKYLNAKPAMIYAVSAFWFSCSCVYAVKVLQTIIEVIAYWLV